jgi:hypothetical protein
VSEGPRRLNNGQRTKYTALTALKSCWLFIAVHSCTASSAGRLIWLPTVCSQIPRKCLSTRFITTADISTHLLASHPVRIITPWALYARVEDQNDSVNVYKCCTLPSPRNVAGLQYLALLLLLPRSLPSSVNSAGPERGRLQCPEHISTYWRWLRPEVDICMREQKYSPQVCCPVCQARIVPQSSR